MSDEKGKLSKPNLFEEDSKFEKLLSSLKGVKDTLEMIEREIPLISGKTKWTPVLTRGFEGITDDKKRFEEVALFFQNLGLGRGVDVTCTKPFDNKTAFQVKQVDYSNLIGTDEGGLMVDFRDLVLTTTDMSVEYQASLDIMKALGKQAAVLTGPLATLSAPLKFTASGELSRNEYSTHMVLGVRILNRTVSFQQTMDSVPTTITPNVYLIPRSTEQPPRDKEETFEGILTKWIMEYHKKTKTESMSQAKQAKTTEKPTKPEESGEEEAAMEEEHKTTKPLDVIDPDTLETLCEAYTWSTGVTHYVSSIKLGAEMYKTMDLQAYETTFKSNDSVNVFDIFTVNEDKESGISREVRDIQKKYVTKVIGRITEVKQPKAAQNKSTNGTGGDDKDTEEATLDVHPRKSYKVDPRDEAVIGYELRSVASLIVKDERLAKTMALAARRYIDEKRREKVGPYYIASHDMESGKTVYLKKGPRSTLTTTIKQSEASPFKIIPDEDDEKEFHIVYEAKDEGKDDNDDPDTPTFRYYLTTRHKFSGVNSEPPSLEQHPKESNATFALHSQLHEWINTQEKLQEWISKGECFLINCENRKWAKDGYFAFKRDISDGPPSHKFFPVCVTYTNENDDLLLAFKLIRGTPLYRKKTPQQEQQQEGVHLMPQ